MDIPPPKIQDLSAQRSLAVTTATALVAWAIFGIITIFCIDYASDSGLGARDIAVIGILLTAVFGIYLGWSPGDSPKGSQEVSKSVLLARGGMAASAIGASVWVAGLGYPLLAGLASVFPAIFLTSMVALWISQGPSVPRGRCAHASGWWIGRRLCPSCNVLIGLPRNDNWFGNGMDCRCDRVVCSLLRFPEVEEQC